MKSHPRAQAAGEGRPPALSVIIPVFNGEPYLRECLDSVCRQTFTDLEVLCIDDGSTDGSVQILEEYAARDPRVRVFRFPANRGAAAARNYGIGLASGDYLGFVDCDDHPCLDFFEKLIRATEGGKYDVAKGNYRYWGEDGKSWPVEYSMNEAIKKHRTNFSFAFASAIYRRALITANSICFPEDQRDIEDPIFTLKAALACENINIVESAEINIRIHKHSATYNVPDIDAISMKFRGLLKIVDILNASPGMAVESYAFVVVFWMTSVLNTSLRNKTEKALRTLLDFLWVVSTRIRLAPDYMHHYKNSGLANIFDAFCTGSEIALSSCLEPQYNIKFLRLALEKRSRHARASKDQACVLIPIYKESPSPAEKASLEQCLRTLGEHPLVFLCPDSLDTAFYREIAETASGTPKFLRFPDIYFCSSVAYSRLMLNPDTYRALADYEYALLYQLDAWVFRDELAHWCSLGYDYVGAPWFEGYAEAASTDKLIEPSGNGGFSLRKVSSFITCINLLRGKILGHDAGFDYFGLANEDGIIVRLFPRLGADFRIAPAREAIKFSYEVHPEILYTVYNTLPFGCHAFLKYGQRFWRRHISCMEYLEPDADAPSGQRPTARAPRADVLRSRFLTRKATEGKKS